MKALCSLIAVLTLATSTHAFAQPAADVETTATVTLEKTDAGFTITAVHLDVSAAIPGASAAAFTTAAENAKAGCPVSRLLNAKITMDARLQT